MGTLALSVCFLFLFLLFGICKKFRSSSYFLFVSQAVHETFGFSFKPVFFFLSPLCLTSDKETAALSSEMFLSARQFVLPANMVALVHEDLFRVDSMVR